MNQTRHKGVVLIAVVALIALAGTAMALLARGATQMRFQTEWDLAEARSRSLIASGRAWAQHQVNSAGAQAAAAEKVLTTDQLAVPDAQLKVSLRPQGERGFEAHVTASHRYGTRTLTRKATFMIPPRPRSDQVGQR